MGKPIFIIEHMEQRMWKWCVIEYKSISKIVGKDYLWITNVKRGSKELENYGKVFRESIKSMNLKKVCILDPEAKKTLETSDKEKFEYFVFGGILGDYPPRKRTKEELTQFLNLAESRNIGKEQLSTDNAVFVVSEILHGKKFGDLKFKNEIEIRINGIESTILPYSYPIVNGKPRVSDELVNYLRRRRDN